jgi:predicted enzyme related to lactoylglutathione lyase
MDKSLEPLAQGSFGYIFVNVRDLEALVPFYRDQLGFQVLFHEPNVCAFLHLKSSRYPQLAFYAAPDKAVIPKTDWFIAINVTHLESVVEQLQAAGVTVSAITPVPNGRAATIQDPEGLQIELHETE